MSSPFTEAPPQQGSQMQQANPLGNDVRNLMAEQLREIRMLREDMRTSAANAVSSQSNPFIMNPFYTEHHDKAIQRAESLVKDTHEMPASNAVINSLANAAVSSGTVDLWRARNGFVDGRGISARDEEYAGLSFGSNVARSVWEGGRDAAGIAGNIGSDMAVGALASRVIGGLAGGPWGVVGSLALGAGAGILGEQTVGRFIDHQVAQFDYRDLLMGSSDRFISSIESNNGLGGFDKDEIKKAAKSMADIQAQVRITRKEMSEIFQGSIENDLLSGTKDLESFETNMKLLVDNVRSSAKILGKTYNEVVSMMGELKKAGIAPGGSALILGQADPVSGALGISQEEYISNVSGLTSAITSGTTRDANAVGAGVAQMMSHYGVDMERARSKSSLYRTSADNFLNNVSAEQLNGIMMGITESGAMSAMGSLMMHASVDEDGKVDREKFQQLAYQLRRGELSNQDLQSLSEAAFSKVQRKHGDFAIKKVESGMGSFRDSNMAIYSTGVNMAGIAGAMQSAGRLEEFNAADESTRKAMIEALIPEAKQGAAYLGSSYFWDEAGEGILFDKGAVGMASGLMSELRGITKKKYDGFEFKYNLDYSNISNLGASEMSRLRGMGAFNTFNYSHLAGVGGLDGLMKSDREGVINEYEANLASLVFGFMDGKDAEKVSKKIARASDNWAMSDEDKIQSMFGITTDSIRKTALTGAGEEKLYTLAMSVGGETLTKKLKDAIELEKKSPGSNESYNEWRDFTRDLAQKTQDAHETGAVYSEATKSGTSVSDAKKTLDRHANAIEQLLDLTQKMLDQETKSIYNRMNNMGGGTYSGFAL